MKWYAETKVTASGAVNDDRFDAIADALAEIEDADPAVEDADLTASLAEGWITASMVIEAGSLEDAVAKTLATMRAAIHAAGCGTAGWEEGLAVRPADDREPISA